MEIAARAGGQKSAVKGKRENRERRKRKVRKTLPVLRSPVEPPV